MLSADAAENEKSSPKQVISGSDGASISFSLSDVDLVIEYQAPRLSERGAVFFALGTHREIGSAVLPFAQNQEGSTVFLPFKADLFVCARSTSSSQRKWEKWKWSDAEASKCEAKFEKTVCTLRIPRSELGLAKKIDCAIYGKDFSDSWGYFFGSNDRDVSPGTGDKYISRYFEVDLAPAARSIATDRPRLGGTKLRIYQLLVRLFGNTNDNRKQNGTLAENGVGKFNDINGAALKSLHDSGFTHIWLTGVLQQATGTDYSKIGQPSDDPDLLKGVAGSPYAIKDYFDVCPDYAGNPAKRLDEFKSLIGRIHGNGMKALIDFVPNHVARSYNSDVKPELNFGTKGNEGAGDDRSTFFSPQNNFFYLKPDSNGPPLRLPTLKDGQPVSPTCKVSGMKCDGFFDNEKDHGKVTGNNVVSWTPSIGDWYETVKLNYGFDFTKADRSVREYPNANAPDKAIPDTWKKMDRVLEHWQSIGVDGFRCDMSHMVPPEFWNWVISKARARNPEVVFVGEAYDNDPAKVPGVDPVISKLHGGKSNVMFDLLDAGFNAVYDDPTYRAIKKIYEGPSWANDIDNAQPDNFIFDNSLRYAENHDEVRLAAKSQWGGVGMKIGAPVSAILYGLSRGPAMVYNGQEVGEPGDGVEGFGGNDARTSIFDYWSMPEMVKWVNGHKYDGGKLSADQKALRSFYGRLLNLLNEPAFREGVCIPLNAVNRDNADYGRVKDEQASGHWLYSFLRFDGASGQRFLIVVNLNPTVAMKDVHVRLTDAQLPAQDRQGRLRILDRLNVPALVDLESTVGYVQQAGVPIGEIPPLTALYLEIKTDTASNQ